MLAPNMSTGIGRTCVAGVATSRPRGTNGESLGASGGESLRPSKGESLRGPSGAGSSDLATAEHSGVPTQQERPVWHGVACATSPVPGLISPLMAAMAKSMAV